MSNEANQVAADKVVSIHYKLTSDEGKVIDQSGEQPLDYLHGHENIVPGLERQLHGKNEGDKLNAVIPPEEAYGKRVDDAQKELPREAFPDDAPLEPGAQFAAQGPDGNLIPLWVLKVDDEQVLVDLNHPLAGETLNFEVEIVGVRDATSEEKEHGHVHGEGGAHD